MSNWNNCKHLRSPTQRNILIKNLVLVLILYISIPYLYFIYTYIFFYILLYIFLFDLIYFCIFFIYFFLQVPFQHFEFIKPNVIKKFDILISYLIFQKQFQFCIYNKIYIKFNLILNIFCVSNIIYIYSI